MVLLVIGRLSALDALLEKCEVLGYRLGALGLNWMQLSPGLAERLSGVRFVSSRKDQFQEGVATDVQEFSSKGGDDVR